MNDSTFNTQILADLGARIRAGEPEAKNTLLRAAADRLERLARKMLGKFPKVRRWEDTADLFQASSLKLLRALERVEFSSTRAFFAFAAEQMRRELIDLWRHHYGPEGAGAHHASGVLERADDENGHAFTPPADNDEPEELDRWSGFHEAVGELPEDERETMGLLFYHGMPQADAAACLGVDVRTLQRRWRRALLLLQSKLRTGGT